ncbi:hypothetical protein JOL79_06275 [Microbispora sp. RL4-1S]|uniref:Serine protease n=1 Tax=Microbispora oryzae TaxID=2806554 RepID=A0A941AGW5_9ACTN|nr:hypothetical protein [Microbispora oryzae]MBP2703405.1 hypothetical protein [Microbispora oryzae]
MKRVLIPLWGVMAVALSLIPGAPAPARAYDITATRVLATSAEAGAAVAHWLTGDGRALAAATPYSLGTRIAPRRSAPPAPAPGGRPGYVPGVAPATRTTTRAADDRLPATTGRAYFLGPDGRPYWCAATSVRSDHRDLVATAGHCVYDIASGVPFREWVFVPDSTHDPLPRLVYAGARVFTHSDFATYRDLDRDYAFVAVYNGIAPARTPLATAARYAAFSGGLKYSVPGGGAAAYVGVRLADAGRLGDRVGGQGLAYNLPAGAPLLLLGYGRTGAQVRSYGRPVGLADPRLKADALLGLRSTTPPVAGSSWYTRYRAARGLGYLNGITIAGAGATAVSPYFDGELFTVYEAARRLRTGSADTDT